ncbi:MAG: ABC transporter permease [Pseudonocardiaceae bacterium]|nr:ABC transporter permease [Pseudonocardiaceae bacterium]
MGEHPVAGTGQLVRLALRRDRITLPLWILLLGVLPASTGSTYEQLYPNVAGRAMLTTAIGGNPSVAVLYGPAFDLSTAGGFVAWRLSGFIAVFIGLMVIFTVTRHTRAEEDTGRAELLGSAVVGRYAMLTAAVLVAAGASALIGVTQVATMIGAGMPAGGSFAFGLATLGAGLVFTAVASVAVQVAEYSRAANGFASSALAVTFLLRGIGDSASDAGWLSWLSPIGWSQQLRPFADERWWVLALPLATALLVGAIGYQLLPRRDLDAGLIRTRTGPAAGAPSLRSPLALAWRLHNGSLVGWTVGTALAGLIMGSIVNGIGTIIGDNEQARQMFERMGGSSAIIDAFLAALIGMFGMVTAVFGVQAALRMRAEESATRVEPLLANAVSRLRWNASHLMVAFVGSGWILLVAGLAMGLAHGLRTGDVPGAVGDVLTGSMAQLPATWVIVGIAAALFGLLPRFSTGAWGVLAAALVLNLFGQMLGLPRALVDISPFAHIPKLPGAEFTAMPLVWLTAVAIAVLAAGLVGFKRRDIT